jgi:branched-chain amino acid transport system substrate-binding protein
MRKPTLILLFFTAAACFGLLLACSGIQDIKVGVAGPLSGEQAAYGQEVLNGVQLAVDKWNADGGINGKKISIIAVDDENDPAKAKEMAYFLCKKNPLIVIGHVDSGCSLQAAKIYEDHKVVMISPTSTTPKLTDMGYKYIFRVCGRDDLQAMHAAVWFAKHRPGETAGVVHDNSDYGTGLAEEFIRNYEFLTNRKVLFNEKVQRGDMQMSAVVEQCKATHPDMIYFGGLANQGGSLLKVLRENGSTCAFMSGDGCYGQRFIDSAGQEYATGAIVTFYPDLSTLPGTNTRDFLAAYRKKYSNEPGPFSIFGYKAADVGFNAIAQAGVPLNGRTISEALHRMTFKTFFGLMRFNEKGDPTEAPYSMYVVEEGTFKEIGP